LDDAAADGVAGEFDAVAEPSLGKHDAAVSLDGFGCW